ncbi:hypothetical protein TRAPUB_14336, partial [Trametes pubescens]
SSRHRPTPCPIEFAALPSPPPYASSTPTPTLPGENLSPGSETHPKRRDEEWRREGAAEPSRRVLTTAGESQTGRLIVALLAEDDTYASRYDKLTALVHSEQDEQAHVSAMSLVEARAQGASQDRPSLVLLSIPGADYAESDT